MVDSTSDWQTRAKGLRENIVDWNTIKEAEKISPDDLDCIVALSNPSKRAILVQSKAKQVPKTVLLLLTTLSNENARYVLAILDDMLRADTTRSNLFYANTSKASQLWDPFIALMRRKDPFLTHGGALVASELASWGTQPEYGMPKETVKQFFQLVLEMLGSENNEYSSTAVRCLQNMLRVPIYRELYVHVNGVGAIITLLCIRDSFQLHYQLIYCLWLLSFSAELAASLSHHKIVSTLTDILADTVKEKVIRVIVGVFRNLLERPLDPMISQMHCSSMVNCRVLTQMKIIEEHNFEDDELRNDVQYITEKLHLALLDMSSFMEYAVEVRSGHLEWSPVHKSEKFWRENVHRLDEMEFELIKKLIYLLESSNDITNICVACYDIGEYVRFNPMGKNTVEALGGKAVVMKMLYHKDANVRYEALLALQKMMVTNWKYLTSKEELEQTKKKPASR